MTNLRIAGATARGVELDVTEEARAVLAELGIEAPSSVTFLMRELNERQQERFALMAKNSGDTDLLLYIMREGAPDVDERVFREMLRDLANTQRAQLIAAYSSGGHVPSPKATAAAVGRLAAQQTEAIMEQLGNSEPSPFLPPTTASAPGSETDSDPQS